MSEIKKLRVGHTFTIGLAFFSSEIAWAFYNGQVPLILTLTPENPAGYLTSFFLVGLLMALDNLIGVFIQPIMGSISDGTRTKFGRRMPYLIVGIPVGALFFALIPWQTSLLTLIIYMFFFGLSMGFYRSQAVSLMPDFVKPVNRSKGNAIINLMGGLGVAFGYGFSLLLSFGIERQWIFLLISVIMVLALFVVLWRIKEKESFSYKLILEAEEVKGEKIKEEKTKPGLIESIKDIASEKDKSTLFILLAIFCWFIGYQGIVALVSVYGVVVLEYPGWLASFLPFIVTVPLLISIYPLSLLPAKIGRRMTIKIGVIIWTSMLILGFFFGLIKAPLGIMAIPLAFLGVGWAMINTNSIVIVWELAPTEKKIGTYTGLYYFFSYMAAILGPMVVGGLTDLLGLPFLMLNGASFFILAFIMMMFVKRGEVELTEEEKIARQKTLQEL